MLYEVTDGKKVPLQQALREFNRLVEPDRCCHFDPDGERCRARGLLSDPESGHLLCLEHVEVSEQPQ